MSMSGKTNLDPGEDDLVDNSTMRSEDNKLLNMNSDVLVTFHELFLCLLQTMKKNFSIYASNE